MNEFAEATMQAVANFAQRVGAGELTKQHGDELGPARKALGVALGLVLFDERLELAAGKMLEQLIEQAGGLYHGGALLGDWDGGQAPSGTVSASPHYRRALLSAPIPFPET